MTAPKTGNSWGFGAKVESPYGTINAATTADGVLLAKVPVVDSPHWLNDGKRGYNPAGGKRADAASSGRWGSMKVSGEGIGFGAAYSAGNKPVLDPLILAAGHTGTGSFGGGTESWKYNPAQQPAALTSLTVDAYLAGQLYRLYGAYADMEIMAGGPVVPSWDFDINGIADFIVDAAILGFTNYPAVSNMPAKADNIALTIGTFTGAVVRSWHFKAGRDSKAARAQMSTGGHAGFTPGMRDPKVEVVIERTGTLFTASPWYNATQLNPYRMAEDGNQVIFSSVFGSVQYKKWSFYSGNPASVGAANATAQAILEDVKDTFDGPTATWTLTFGFYPSTYLASDDYTILYN